MDPITSTSNVEDSQPKNQPKNKDDHSAPFVRCEYVMRNGMYCDKSANSNPEEHRCPRHLKSINRVKCTFPTCPYWTCSKNAKCAEHPLVRNTEAILKSISEQIRDLEIDQPLSSLPTFPCNYVSSRGNTCPKSSFGGTTRCITHYGSPSKDKCKYSECVRYTFSKTGFCPLHAAKLGLYGPEDKRKVKVKDMLVIRPERSEVECQ